MIQTKSCRLTLKQVGEDGVFEGYASAFGNLDSDSEVFDKGAFLRTIKNKGGVIPILWQHSQPEPVGWNHELEEDEHGLRVKGKLLMDAEKGRYARAFLAGAQEIGAKAGLSIGFRTPNNGSYFKDGVKHFREVEVMEYSIVTFPANDQASVTSVKAAVPFQDLPLASEDRSWDAAAATRRVRAWAGGDNTDWSKYRRAFLWYDSSNAEVLGSYKLPIADVIDGSLRAVPRAIYAAAGRLNQADIPDADKAKARAHLSRYYKKLGKDPPFKSGEKAMMMDFNAAMMAAEAEADMNEKRWQMESALRHAIGTAVEDHESTMDDRKSSIAASLKQYADAMSAWWSDFLDMMPEHEEGMKAGRTISAATKQRIQKAIEHLEEADGHSRMAAKVRTKALGSLRDMRDGYDDVNKPHPVGGGKSQEEEAELAGVLASLDSFRRKMV